MDATAIAVEFAAFRTPSEVSRRLADFGRLHGFPVHAIGPLPTPERPVEDAWFMVQNWPDEWGRTYFEEGFGEFDPVPQAAMVLNHPMTITEIRRGGAGFMPDPRADRLFDVARGLGMPCAVVIPIFGPQQYRAIACFAGPGPDPDPQVLAALHLVGLYAHDRIRALSRQALHDAAALSEREREILVAAGLGKSDGDIALTFGITVRTVRFHFANIRWKFGADSRAHAIAMAANLGILGK